MKAIIFSLKSTSYALMFFGILLTCLYATPSYAAYNPSSSYSRTFYNPRISGVRLDWCYRWARNCGIPAASAYCRRKGYRRAERYSVAHNIGYTKIISSGQICNRPFCDGFRWVRCVGGRRGGGGPGGYVPGGHHGPGFGPAGSRGTRTFMRPSYRGYRLDWCYRWGTSCGRPPANTFCKRMGYRGVLAYKIQHDIGLTRIIGTGQICRFPYCDGFRWVKCYR